MRDITVFLLPVESLTIVSKEALRWFWLERFHGMRAETAVYIVLCPLGFVTCVPARDGKTKVKRLGFLGF